ncbi:DNA topoisomerase IV subunit A [Methylobacillus sp. Pita2]|uniref:DNA topoisomerase IV subunit A n=1 Tax=Methylobacillus sp. Pita2 TaxID=3383245 RepID=UPI0038B5A3AE
MSVFDRKKGTTTPIDNGDLFEGLAESNQPITQVEHNDENAQAQATQEPIVEASTIEPVYEAAAGSEESDVAVEVLEPESEVVMEPESNDDQNALVASAGGDVVPPFIPMDELMGFGRDGEGGETANLGAYAETQYLMYAMSVVKGRAIPNVQDGQKPVHRRILFAMRQLGLTHSAKHVKSARVVGDVIGKYHPHGDSAAYEAAVRLAQDFSQRYPLIDGQGNFGSRDGDSAAAMRYTEMRLTPISELLLSEIDMGTVDFNKNYDGTFDEPALLPARLPFLLMNGYSGIAVGISGDCPPHNLREVSEAAILALKDLGKLNGQEPTPAQTESLFNSMMEIVPGPDFPEGAQVISSRNDLLQAYRTGRGNLRARCRWEVEQLARGQYRIIITELPYQLSPLSVMAKIEEITNPKIPKNKKALTQEQITRKQALQAMLDIYRNESGDTVRIVLEPKTSKIDPEALMNFLFTYTDLEMGFSINLNTLGLDGAPRQKGIVEVLREWAQFRFATVTRRSQFSLDKINARIHILEGRMIAFLNIEEVIRVIRESDEPKASLIAVFKLSEVQAEDILEIRLRQLARLEGFKIENEINQLREEAAGLMELLGNDTSMRNQIIKEIRDDIKKFGDDRRTLIEPVERVRVDTNAMVSDEPVTIILSKQGWIRSRQGHDVDVEALTWKPADSQMVVLQTRTISQIILLDTNGRSYSFPASQVPGGKGDGVPVTSLVDLQEGGKIAHVLSGDLESSYLFAGENGYGFMAKLSGLVARGKSGKAFMTVEAKEKIHAPVPVPAEIGDHHLVAKSSEGKMLIFRLDEMKTLNSGGKGVTIMDIPDGNVIAEIGIYPSPLAVTVTSKRGKESVLQGEALQKYILKRARKGSLL